MKYKCVLFKINLYVITTQQLELQNILQNCDCIVESRSNYAMICNAMQRVYAPVLNYACARRGKRILPLLSLSAAKRKHFCLQKC